MNHSQDSTTAMATEPVDEENMRVRRGQIIENPISGERIQLLETAGDTNGTYMSFELSLAPGGRVPSTHTHPHQQERFTVLEGQMRFRVGLRRIRVGPGETVTVPPGRAHAFANAGPGAARLIVEARPALDMADMLAAAAQLAQEDQAANRRVPRPLHLALFLRRFQAEVQPPFVPAWLVRVIVRPLARLADARGLDSRYRRVAGEHHSSL